MLPVALTIAGSDPSGGAGIQADLKTFHQFGVYGQAVISLLTVQNTQSVARVQVIDPELVRQQIEAVVADIPPNAVKTGALGDAGVVQVVADWAKTRTSPLIVDPVMISKHGSALISQQAQQVLRQELLPNCTLITPNIPEAEALTGVQLQTESDILKAAESLLSLGCGAVLIKGGHLPGHPVDWFMDQDGYFQLSGRRVQTRHSHGTGCTLSAAITALLALNVDLREAVRQAKHFVQQAIETAPGLGHGCGPINHFASVR